METRSNRHEEVEFVNKVNQEYIPRLTRMETMMKTQREMNAEIKNVKNEIKDLDEDLLHNYDAVQKMDLFYLSG